MKSTIMNKLIIGGSASNPENADHIKIICDAMINETPIHTCLKYGNGLHLIKKCIDITRIKPKLIVKVYINSSESWLRSSMEEQLQEIYKIIQIREIYALQICCNPKFNDITGNSVFRKKLLNYKSDGMIKKLYLEVYWQYSLNMIEFLGDELFDGYIFYHNIYLREMNTELYRKIYHSNK